MAVTSMRRMETYTCKAHFDTCNVGSLSGSRDDNTMERRNRKSESGGGGTIAVEEKALHQVPGRFFINGVSRIDNLYTQQGNKGTNQDALIVWEANLKNEANNGFFQNPLKNIFSSAKRDFSDAIDGSNKWVCVLMVKDWWPIATGFRRRLSGPQPRVADDIWCCMEVEVD
ncbi:PPM-type phosphatase domain-containing protein [Forsythia ovata]|uniref:PPM-type phosphatase domain-containing protein n=1 Tax=Forsythia ovata TaxID=205694 RepID=A0ABD1S6R8_9LAMI